MSTSQPTVFVLYQDNTPAMPTYAAKARVLVREKKAKIVKLSPFTIKLKYETATREAQPVVLGVDTGSKFVGVSAIANGVVLYSGEAALRTDIHDKMETRKSLRRGRRSRLQRRPARWSNRANSRREGRLSPTVVSKLQSHERCINFVKKILPVSKIVVETASFDTQKMQNPEISGVEYQRGELHGYEIREYLYQKWERKCAYCGKKDVPFEIEHIIPRSRGGSGRVSNLTIACHECNQAKGNKTAKEFGKPEIEKRAKMPLKDTAHVSGMKTALMLNLRTKYSNLEICETRGYITKYKRNEILKLAKSHANDAISIACEMGETVTPPNGYFKIWFRKRASRSLHDSCPPKCHEFSKAQLRAEFLEKLRDEKTKEISFEVKEGKALDSAIGKALKAGTLRSRPAGAPVPTKLEAKAFYDLVPGYEIVRKRTKRNPVYNSNNKTPRDGKPRDGRRPSDTTKGKFGKWRKGHLLSYPLTGSQKVGVLTGTDARGQCRYEFFDGSKDRKNVKHAKLLQRATSINHFFISVKENRAATIE